MFYTSAIKSSVYIYHAPSLWSLPNILLLTLWFWCWIGAYFIKRRLSCPFTQSPPISPLSQLTLALLAERDTSTLLWGILSPSNPDILFPVTFSPMPLAGKCLRFGVQEWKGSIRKRASLPTGLNNGKEKKNG